MTTSLSSTLDIARPVKWSHRLLPLLVILFAIGGAGCADEYGPYGYGYGPGYYSRYPGYAPYPGYGYGGYPGSVSVEIGDRAYYTRGPGYYVGRSYYVWRPGHWVFRNGRRVWVHGRYVLR